MMPISEWIEKLGRTVFEAPFGGTGISPNAPELAEIRLAVLDEIKAKSHRVAGRDVFPYNIVRIHLRGIPEEQEGVFQGRFFSDFFEQELRGGLARSNYRFPEDLAVEVETTPALPGPKDAWMWIETVSRSAPPPAPAQRRPARLQVLKGAANHADLALAKIRTNIGRTAEVFRTDGPSRRNDLAFTDENEINRTVSREHAHILLDKKSGEYRLFNDRTYKPGSKQSASCGLWIIRDGLSQEVHRSPRGFRLQSGDEIHFGRAVVRFIQK
jgi:hypothetical protein